MIDQNTGVEHEELKAQTFNPNEHLMQIKSSQGMKDYLPVQWRLVWFRSVCPEGTIETEIIHLDLDRETEEEIFQWNPELRRSERTTRRANGFAVFRAIVKDGKGGIAIGTKSEKAASFPDYIEKAETGAIGRALAALGFGTQFAPELNEEHRIVDSPVERSQTSASNGNNSTTRRPSNAVRPIPAPNQNNVTRPVPTVSQNGAGRPAPTTNSIASDAPATEQELTSIHKLCERLGKPEPQESLTHQGARELIGQLTQEYKQTQQNRRAS